MAEYFASGDWHVEPGKEDAFVERWTEFLQWTRKSQHGLVSARLVRGASDTSHFVSMAEWEDAESRTTWKTSPDFMRLLGACRDLCTSMTSDDYTLSQVI